MSVDIASIEPYIRQFAAARSLLPGAGFAWLDATLLNSWLLVPRGLVGLLMISA